MKFSIEQEKVIELFNNDKNIFMSGPGGTGKSFLIKYLVQLSYKTRKNIQVCALTGCASVLLNCNAKTIHSWAGIGLGNDDVDIIINKLLKNYFYLKKWKNIECLIIDEISMMSKKMFDMLDTIGRKLRNNNKPWGGIQLIFSGDFYQLSPVGNKDGDIDSKKFCFESDNWDQTFQNNVILKYIFRQENKEFSDILNNIRIGKLKEKDINILNKRLDIETNNLEIKPIKLFPTKIKVKNLNDTELEKLKDIEKIYEYKVNLKKNKHSDELIKHEINYILKNSLFEEKIILKKNCQVMCVANLDLSNGISNGSTGIVIDFVGDDPKVKFCNNKEFIISKKEWKSEKIKELSIYQHPLILAWGITIHKSQGASLDIAEIDVGNSIFTSGQTYVALSRLKSLDGLYLKSFNPNNIIANKKVKKFYKKIKKIAL